MSEQTISLGILALISLFAFFGAIWGIIRGLRKTVWRGVWLLLTAVVLFFTAGLVVNLLLHADVTFLNLSYNGQNFTTFYAMLMEIINSVMNLQSTPETLITVNQILDLSKLILNSVVFAILFIVLKYLLLPFNALTYRWFFKSTEEKIYNKKLKQYKINEKIYKLHVKSFKRIAAHGFADDFIEYEENLKEIKENKEASSLELLQALKKRVDKKAAEAQAASQTPKEKEAINKLIEGGASPSQLKEEIEKEKKEYNKEKSIKDKLDLEELEKEEKLIDELEKEENKKREKEEKLENEKEKQEEQLEREKEKQEELEKEDILIEELEELEYKREKQEIENEKLEREKVKLEREKEKIDHNRHRPGEVIPVEKFTKEDKEEVENKEFIPSDEYQPKIKEEKSEITKPEKPLAPKKSRFLGMLVGMLVGLFTCAMMLTPITGMLNLAVEVNKRSATIIDESSTEGLLYAALSGSSVAELNYIKDFLNAYEKSSTNGVLKYSGVNGVSLFTFNLLSNIKINDVTVNIVEDFLKVIDFAIAGKEFSENIAIINTDLTRSELEVLIADSRSLVEKAFDVQVVRALGNDFMPILEDYAQKFIEEIEELPFGNKNVLTDMVSTVLQNILQNNQDNAVDNIKNDVFAFIEVLEALNENIIENNQPTNESVLTILLHQNYERDKDRLVNFLSNENNASKIFGKLLNTKIISCVLPHVTYSLVEFLGKLQGFEFNVPDELSEFKRLQMNNAILNIILESLNLFREFDLSKGFDVNNITSSAIISVGKVIDMVKGGLLPAQTYNEILNKLKVVITENVQIAVGAEIDISKASHAITNCMQNVESWENEFTVFATVFSGLFSQYNGNEPIFDLTNDIDISTLDFGRLGAKLDILKNGYLGNSSVLLSSIYQSDNDISFESYFKTNETNNLQLLMGTALESVAAKLKIDNAEDEIIVNLAIMLEERVVPRIMDKNLVVGWETEFVKLATLLDLQKLTNPEDGSINLVEVGTVLDTFIAKNSILVNADDIKELIVNLITSMKDSFVKDILNPTIKNAILKAVGSIDELDNGSIIYNIKNENIASFEIEFSHLSNLLSIDFSSEGGTGLLLGYLILLDDLGNAIGLYGDYAEIILPTNTEGNGGELDSILNNADININSQIITKTKINELLVTILEDLTIGKLGGKFDGIINTIKGRIESEEINNYEQEFKAIQYLLDISEYVNLTEFTENELKIIGGYFDDVSYSVLVGDSGKQVLTSIVNSITDDAGDLIDMLNDINSAVNNLAETTSISIIGSIVNNIENLNYAEYNYSTQYEAAGILKKTLNEIAGKTWLKNISLLDIMVMKNNVYEISRILNNLQSNIITQSKATRYITIYIYSSIKQAMYEGTPTPPPPNAEFTSYINSFGEYLKNNVNGIANEIYWNNAWSSEEEKSEIIPPTFDSENILSTDFDYALIRIINSYEDSLII